MNLVSTRELTAKPRETWEKLSEQGELLVTKNGKPSALLIDVEDDNLDEIIRLLRQSKATRLLAQIRAEASERGTMTLEEINEEIAAARREAS
ncbi:MAG: hypothetical protein FWE46_04485 [Coriobacteriia bacterium]|nr:hypothetical protein [Coriobacteriia bacterium]MCL2537274.1 hypothetical protein [Coriobacteriia bacterium]